ncbi:hypothetical protein [Burkholderia territorii]|uniref:hypothetical protein n=1 Tax=Burkholderia territorii TaxID=1503055 RepID=UPI00075309A0|nr:hypothetical protein [Burkholderia territorii]KWO62555.1 hypothetical protein WT98_30255 [Burkholderia territorii]
MPTIIDALIVTLGLDPAGYQKGADQADKAGKKLATDQEANAKKITESSKKASDAQIAQAKKQEEAAKKLAEQYGKVKLELLDMATNTLAATGLGKMIGSTVTGLSQLQTQSQLLGYSSNEIAKWQNVVKNLGGDPGEFNQFAARITKLRSDLAQGQQTPEDMQFQARLQRLGVDYDTATTGSLQSVFTQIAESQKGKSNADIANNLSQYLGLGPGMIQLIQSGASGIAESYKNAAGANNDAASDAKKLDKAYQDLKTKIETSLQNFPGFDAGMKGATAGLEELGKFASDHPTGTAIAGLAGMGALLVGGKLALGKVLGKFLGGKGGAIGGALGGAGGALPVFVTNMPGSGGPSLPELPASGEAGAAGESLLGRAMPWLARIGVGTALMLHSENLNTGEDEQLRKIRAAEAAAGGKWPGDTVKHQPDVAPPAPADKGMVTNLGDSAFGMLIARGEGDYNSVNRGAAGGYKAGTEDLGNMTVAQVMAAQRSHQFNAAGRYQIIGSTLTDAAKALGLSGNEKFDKGMQDRIFTQYLLQNKRRAIGDYLSGKSNDLKGAIKAASLEWASVADPDTGKSHYAGTGNNKASISVAEMARALQAARSGGPSMNAMLSAGRQATHGGSSTVNSKSETHIGQITVVSSDTKNGTTVANDMRDQISQHGLIANSAIPVT